MRNSLSFPALTAADLAELTAFRHELHRHPEVSGAEAATAARVAAALAALGPDRVLTGLGGHGVAAVFDSGRPGPTVLFRSELDALPIHEVGGHGHASEVPGVAHLCGHDGHSTILLGLARVLSRARPPLGRVVLMFQPAEETGAGAAAVIADPAFAAIRPDWAFSLHNWPGIARGTALLGTGPVNCASRGMRIRFSGQTAHASTPWQGLSPMPAVAALMPALAALGSGPPPGPGFSMVTVTHATLGEPTFGIAPGAATVLATLRTVDDAVMAALVAAAEALARATAADHGLGIEIDYADIFLASVNDAEAAAVLAEGLAAAGLRHEPQTRPILASEDYGRFRLDGATSAMLFLGSGEDCAGLHTPGYDFPDDLIGQGVALFTQTLAACLSRAG
jgi:amidohydrolase